MDPFSAAAGIAGLISLGIELGKGLKTYCEDFQSMDDDIAILRQHAERLATFVEMLNSRVEGQDQVDPALSRSLKECHDACNVCLQDFGALSTKYSRSPRAKSTGVRERWEAALTHFHYPLQKKRFDALEVKMEKFRSELSTRLQLLNYDGTIELCNTITTENAKFLSAIEPLPQIKKAIDQLPEVLVSQIIQALKRDLNLAMESSSRPSSAVEGPKLHGPNPFDDTQQASSQNGSRHSTTSQFGDDVTTAQENTIFVAGTTGLERPRDISPSGMVMVASSSQAGQLHHGRFQSVRFHGFRCTCKPINQRNRPTSRRSSDADHRTDCPVSFLNGRRASATGNYVLKTLFRYLASVTHYRVEFNLTAQAIVLKTSPAFLLIERLDDLKLMRNENELESGLLTILTNLKELFQQHRAWPTDTLPNGWSILHIACCLLGYEWSQPMAHVYFKFLEALVNMGVPVNGTGRLGTPLRLLLLGFGLCRYHDVVSNAGAHLYMARGLIDLDAYYAEDPNGVENQMVIYNSMLLLPSIYRNLSNSLEAFDYGELCCALFRKSEASVLQIMSASPDHIFERGHHNQTPIHIAIFWPDGLRLLFGLAGEACYDIIDEEDTTGLTPIQCAISMKQTESVELLLERRASINLENAENFLTHSSLLFLDGDATICTILAKELAKRRKSMRDYAFDQLSDKEMDHFQLGQKTMLQEEAYDVVASLRDSGVWVPGEYELVRPGSIYHSPFMTATLAEALFQSGFHEVDSMWEGLTPLMFVACSSLIGTSRLIDWFDEHGASFFTSIPHLKKNGDDQYLNTDEKEFKVIHRLAYLVGLWSSKGLQYFPQPSLLPRISPRFFSSAPKDPCQCYCAPDGCTPTSLLAKGWLEAWNYGGQPGQEAFSFHKHLLSLLPGEDREVTSGIIRVITFERLGMRHTCCKHNEYKGRVEGFHTLDILDFSMGSVGFVSVTDPSEVAEIRGEVGVNGDAGEDRYLAKDLEELMMEFDTALGDFEDFKNLIKFWDFWSDRMSRFERGRPMTSRKSRRAILDLGVHLERVHEVE